MNRHSARFIENYHGVVFKGYRNAEIVVCFQGNAVIRTQDYYVAVFNNINTADSFAVPGNTAVQPFQLCKKPS